MALNKMRYGKFTWPNNPGTSTIECNKVHVVHKYPGFNGIDIEDYGNDAVVLSGHGEFFGADAYRNWGKLMDEFNKNSVQSFYHPIYSSAKSGKMIKLASSVEPREEYVAYDFEIIIGNNLNNTKAYTLSNGVSGPKAYGTTTYGSGGSSGSGSSKSSGASSKPQFKVGDTVIVNGRVYVDKKAKQYTHTVSNLRTTITNVQYGDGNLCPIHYGSNPAEWVSEASVTKVGKTASSDNITVHVMRQGETFQGICAKYGISDWKSVASYNGIKNIKDVKVGQKIKIVK